MRIAAKKIEPIPFGPLLIAPVQIVRQIDIHLFYYIDFSFILRMAAHHARAFYYGEAPHKKNKKSTQPRTTLSGQFGTFGPIIGIFSEGCPPNFIFQNDLFRNISKDSFFKCLRRSYLVHLVHLSLCCATLVDLYDFQKNICSI